MGALDDLGVTVIGAGIAGLAAACALGQRGARVRVVERAPLLSEVGAGLQLSPNAMRVIDALGLGPSLDAVSLPCRLRMMPPWPRRAVRSAAATWPW